MDRYIGLDVHAASCTAAVMDAQGKRLPEVLNTPGRHCPRSVQETGRRRAHCARRRASSALVTFSPTA